MDYAPARFRRSERKLAGRRHTAPVGEVQRERHALSGRSAEVGDSAALYLVRVAQGYITGGVRFVATQIGMAAEVEDVVSHYTMFYTKPVGKYVLNVCACRHARSWGERVTEELCAKLGVHPGQTTADGEFTVIEVECLGACDRAPVVMVNDDWHERLAPEQAGAFVDEIKKRGRAAFTGCHLHVEKT
jgi:NADH-quinone oxidoreductase subunit E